MAKITHVRKAQQRYVMVPVLDGDGEQVVTETARQTRAMAATEPGMVYEAWLIARQILLVSGHGAS